MLVYVDSSALVKLVIDEPDAAALRTYLARDMHIVVSRVGLIEAGRVVSRADVTRKPSWDELVQSISVRELEPSTAEIATAIQPGSLRTLDAIHLATAYELRDDLDAFVTYDARLAAAATDQGLPVASPT